ncbi:hypothetical protein F2Q70_00010291 [Brassica cretica]|uniref:phospholipase D n=1 Tax=Brassica cretica TaxID=69181 RepID=A0A8S9MAJ2_BRACR|nr:hypothetical protein F2Q70_00010291 [Brassica cretica]
MSMEGSSNGSLRLVLLHGNLDVWVKEAKNLPNMDRFRRYKKNSTSDPFVTVSIAGAKIGTTFVVDNDENPVWKQHFYVPVAHHAKVVKFVVKDSDRFGAKFIGNVGIPTEELCSGNTIEGLFPILDSSGKPCKKGAVLSLAIQYTPVEMMKFYQMGVGNECEGVPGTYFPLRKGGRVTLYQDAHVEDGTLPSVDLDGGMKYIHGKCWEDMADAIRQAKNLIYITGWSVYHPVRLVRRNNDPTNGTLGDLLKERSQEGVRVLLLVWDDPTSRSFLGYRTRGYMKTSDEETRHFFKNSSVQVIICPRSGGRGLHSFVKKTEVQTIYTHHQKTVIVDAEAAQGRRKIVAFVGGLDVCKGRFDTPKHPLFTTLKTLHKDDFYNNCFGIFGYRMSLWAEHLGSLEKGFEEPENMECVRRVRRLSELNWRQYAAEEVTEMTSHLLKYPVQVDRTGKVSSLPGCETFPGLGGSIIDTGFVIKENLTI